MRESTLSTSIDVDALAPTHDYRHDHLRHGRGLVDTEQVWSDVRREFAAATGVSGTQEIDAPKVMGANSMEWAAAMRENNGVDLSGRGDLPGHRGWRQGRIRAST